MVFFLQTCLLPLLALSKYSNMPYEVIVRPIEPATPRAARLNASTSSSVVYSRHGLWRLNQLREVETSHAHNALWGCFWRVGFFFLQIKRVNFPLPLAIPCTCLRAFDPPAFGGL